MAVSDHDIQAFGVFAEQFVAAREEAAARAPQRGSHTSFAVDTGLGGQWSRLVRLASDDGALAAALQAQGWGQYR